MRKILITLLLLLAAQQVAQAQIGQVAPMRGKVKFLTSTFNDNKMWTFWPDVKINNSTKFSAIPVGYAIDQEGIVKYIGVNQYASFWTSDSQDGTATYRYIYVSKNDVFSGRGDKESFRASVRCVKDDNKEE